MPKIIKNCNDYCNKRVKEREWKLEKLEKLKSFKCDQKERRLQKMMKMAI